MKLYVKGTSINVAVSFIKVVNFDEGTNFKVATSKVFSLTTFYLFISLIYI